jgi:SAM-dependent methyltransferase
MGETNYEAYQEMPYAGSAYADSHPASMWPIAALMGLSPAAVDDCRVLEVGCARGGNLVPMAASLPTSRFVGLDLSDHHIAQASAARDALGLRNLELVRGDIAEVGGQLGTFDYIIAHGVYSWLPAPTRDRLMALCGSALAPQGIAYISHNVYPGWHRKLALRHMMLYHARGIERATDRVAAAKALLEFLSTASSPRDASYKLWLHEEAEFLLDATDHYVFHDHLAVHNEPSYFHEFVAAAAPHGLEFVADAYLPANFGNMLPERLTGDLAELTAGDRVAFEQYQDFVLNRPFRKTLLCRRDAGPAARPVTAAVAKTHVMTDLQPIAEEGGGPRSWQRGARKLGEVNEATHGLLSILAARWPGTVPFAELFDGYRALELGEDPAGSTQEQFCDDLFLLALNHMVSLRATRLEAPPTRAQPVTLAWVRQELADSAGRLTTMHHRTATLAPPLRVLARLADGTRDEAALLEGLIAAVDEGDLPLPVADATPEQVREGLAGGLQRGLAQLYHMGLLG